MANRDSAFLWESEALRSAPRRPRPSGEADGIGTLIEANDWLTLKEASEATGVPTATIRKWARHQNIPSFLEKTPEGHLRIVSLAGIREWAEEIGRELEIPAPEHHADPGAPDGATVDLTGPNRVPDGPRIPEGSMLVPLDAWNKMLNQLGNLHQAGQQLAEARERAAKAETESRFLKERLSEMRIELERTREASAALHQVSDRDLAEGEADEATSRPSSTTLTGTAAALAGKIYQGWRRRRGKS